MSGYPTEPSAFTGFNTNDSGAASASAPATTEVNPNLFLSAKLDNAAFELEFSTQGADKSAASCLKSKLGELLTNTAQINQAALQATPGVTGYQANYARLWEEIFGLEDIHLEFRGPKLTLSEHQRIATALLAPLGLAAAPEEDVLPAITQAGLNRGESFVPFETLELNYELALRMIDAFLEVTHQIQVEKLAPAEIAIADRYTTLTAERRPEPRATVANLFAAAAGAAAPTTGGASASAGPGSAASTNSSGSSTLYYPPSASSSACNSAPSSSQSVPGRGGHY